MIIQIPVHHESSPEVGRESYFIPTTIVLSKTGVSIYNPVYVGRDARLKSKSCYIGQGKKKEKKEDRFLVNYSPICGGKVIFCESLAVKDEEGVVAKWHDKEEPPPTRGMTCLTKPQP